jgi:predicted acyl esterase
MCAWEGTSDVYRDLYYHGGILSTFSQHWYTRLVNGRQHGLGVRGLRSRVTGELVAGPETLTLEELAANRRELWDDVVAHPLIDDYWAPRLPDLEQIEVPLLSAGNWGGQGLHLRGNVEGFLRAGSAQKWLELHGGQHWASFYTDYGVALQKRFFGHFLKGEDTGWDRQPRVQLQVRHPGERFVERHEDQWPPARTQRVRYYLGPDGTLSTDRPDAVAAVPYRALGDGLTFLSAPLVEPLEITGHPAARLYLSSSTEDADVFLVLRVFTPALSEVTFIGSNDPHTPVAHGWLRASHRELDGERTREDRPFRAHRERRPLVPGEVYPLEVDIWPTSIVVPAGYRIGLTVRGRDHVGQGVAPQPIPLPGTGTGSGFEGVGPFRHVDPANRPAELFGGELTLHWTDGEAPYVVLPVLPS